MLFDAYLFVDWSGSSVPRTGKDAIWVGERVGDERLAEVNPATRDAASAHLRERLRAHVAAGRRVLVGFDFPFGYPAGLAAALGLGGSPPWQAVWERLADRIEDGPGNRNNRFAVAAELNRVATGISGPFWACPPARASATLTTTRTVPFPVPFAGGELPRVRITETLLPGVQESWKLLGAGSAGGQALVGIPRVHALRDDPGLAPYSAVWPFETGFTPRPSRSPGPSIVHAEIWPGIADGDLIAAEMATTGAVRDQAQVRLMCRWARERDIARALAGWFDRPAGLDDDTARVAEGEEGWILGCPGPGGAPAGQVA